MAKRKIVKIDEDRCNGCSICIPNCYEGALQMIDNKARLISDLFCDGLGNCLGHCPEGAIEIIQREAEPYDEIKVMKENIVPKGDNTIKAHLEHLKDHGADKFLQEAICYLNENDISNPLKKSGWKENSKADDKKKWFANKENKIECGCPGAKMMDLSKNLAENSHIDKGSETGQRSSCLKQWPVQLHLVSPQAPYFHKADVLFAADCTAFSIGDFHKDFMREKISHNCMP
jgi:ferredoxin